MNGMEITKDIALKVLSVVDAGLSSGVGKPVPGQMCVEAAVCYALGLPHGDDPQCVSRALRALKIRLNDSNWSSDQARAKGLRRLSVAQLGSRDVLDDREFARRCAELAIRKAVPIALRAAASIHHDSNHKAAMLDAAARCEKEGTREAALHAKNVAASASASADAYADADADASASASASADASADASAYASAYADADASAYASASADASAYAYASASASADADASAYADADASASADASADASAYASAYAYASAERAKIRDKVLSDFAEDVVQILIEMKAPGCQWLELTETVAA